LKILKYGGTKAAHQRIFFNCNNQTILEHFQQFRIQGLNPTRIGNPNRVALFRQ